MEYGDRQDRAEVITCLYTGPMSWSARWCVLVNGTRPWPSFISSAVHSRSPADPDRAHDAGQRHLHRRIGSRRRGTAAWAVLAVAARSMNPRPDRVAGGPLAAQRRRAIELAGAAAVRFCKR